MQNFLYAIIVGAGISAVFDLFRIIRIALSHKSVFVFIEDLLFCLMSLAGTIFFFTVYNDGVFRLYLIAGILLGFIIWHFTLGSLIIFQAKLIIRIFKVILRFVLLPFKLIFKLICKFLKKILLICKKLFIFCKKRVIILKSVCLTRKKEKE